MNKSSLSHYFDVIISKREENIPEVFVNLLPFKTISLFSVQGIIIAY